MKRYLILKLLGVNLAVIGFVIIMVWISIDTLAAGYFVTLMEKYNISPEPAHAMFVNAVHRYLLWASLAAVILAVLLSYILMRRVLAPLVRMTVITREIAAGNFSVRVPGVAPDEVGQLAGAFNRMAESLEKMETLRRNLMIDVAHELRTPLTNIRGYLEALAEEVLPPSKDTLDLLHKETLRLARLVEDVLQLARADASHGRLEPEPVDLKDLVEAAAAPYAAALTQKSITLQIHAPGGRIIVPADRKRIGRALRNLTDNAARYTPPGGHLDIYIETGNRQARVEYANDAGELSRADLPYLFERFYRGEKSRSRRHGGAGIGLAIVKELVEAHGGTVGADLIEGRVRIWFSFPLDGNIGSQN